MAEVIRMPLLSDTMTEGKIVKWNKQVGDKVKSDDVLADVETDKATMEVVGYADGTLLYIGVPEGKAAQINEIIAIVGKEGEDYKSLLDGGSAAPAPAAAAPADIPQVVGDDRWDIATGPRQQDDGIHFERRGLPQGFNPIRMGPPERFRMRGRASLADIVREVSKTLFWPPGYTDDPCPGLKKAVQIFSKAGTDRQRDLLEDAVLLHSRYCD